MWIAVNEDGVSILDHNTMVREGGGWLPDPQIVPLPLLSGLKGLAK